MRRALLALVLVASSASWSSAQTMTAGGPLTSRGLSAIGSSITAEEVLAAAGKGLTVGSRAAGAAITRVLPFAGRVVGWGGLLTLGPELITAGMNWAYKEASIQAGNADLDRWNAGAQPVIARYPFVGGAFSGITYENPQIMCNSNVWKGTWWSAVRTDHNYIPARTQLSYYVLQGNPGPNIDGMSPGRAPVASDCDGVEPGAGGTPAPSFDSLPYAAAVAAAALVNKYVQTRPERVTPSMSFSGPEPTLNQKADALLDPKIDSNGDGVSDGAAVAIKREPGAPLDVIKPEDLTSTAVVNNPDGTITVKRTDVSPLDGSLTIKSNTYQPGSTVPSYATQPDGSVTGTTRTIGADGSVTVTTSNVRIDTVLNGDGTRTDTTTTVTNTTTTTPAGAVSTASKTDVASKTVPKDVTKPCVTGDPACTPKAEPCPPGQVKGSDGVCKPPDPGDVCGDLSLARALSHLGSFLRDVFLPCDPLDFSAFRDLIKDKFPFSISLAVNSFMDSSAGSGGGANPLPTELGPFKFDWTWTANFLVFVKLAFRTLLWTLFFRWLVEKVSGQVVLQ